MKTGLENWDLCLGFFKKPVCSKLSGRKPGTHGVALIITLGAVVMLTLLILAFFSKALLNRQISYSSTNLIKADMLARGALDSVMGEVREEINAGSTAESITQGTQTFTYYTPSSNARVVLSRDSNTSENNLIRRSSSALPSNAPTGALTAASSASTTSASLNNRAVSFGSWNKSKLWASSAMNSNNTPNWIIVTRGGANSSVSASTAATKSNLGYAIGRYAYAIYDEGGLLDVNVAGAPSGVSASDAGSKASTAFADLTIAGVGTAQATGLADWRNHTTKSNYVDYIIGNGSTYGPHGSYADLSAAATGFTKVIAGDNAFLSRQDLLKYAKDKNISDAALKYLGTFSYMRNSPLFTPLTITAENPDLKKVFVRVTDDDGNAVSPVEYERLKRFPLSYLNLLAQDPSTLSTEDKAKIKKYFGLAPSTFATSSFHAWVYTGKRSGNSAQVASFGDFGSYSSSTHVWTLDRQPDLFELIKAGLNNGSLGSICANSGAIKQATGTVYSPEENPHQHIARIVANMIDQYDDDSYPTTIMMGSDETTAANPINTVYGIENLPYFSELYYKINFPNGFDNATNANGHIYFELWNPHRQMVYTGAKPAKIRIIANDDATIQLNGTRTYTRDPSDGSSKSHLFTMSPTRFISTADTSNTKGMGIGSLDKYYSPRIVYNESGSLDAAGTPDDTIRDDASDGLRNSAGDIVPFNSFLMGALTAFQTAPGKYAFYNTSYLGGATTVLKQDGFNNDVSWPDYPNFLGNYVSLNISNAVFLLQYQDADGSWRTYSTFAGYASKSGSTGLQPTGHFQQGGVNYANYTNGDPYNASRTNFFNQRIDLPTSAVPKPDPRTFRYRGGSATSATYNAAMGTSAGPSEHGPSDYPAKVGGVWPLGLLYTNNGTFKLKDSVGNVYRVSDGYLGANPMSSTATTARPVILNRPFRSVSELGYVFRDIPWRSLNFFSSDDGNAAGTGIADAALLDIFSVEDGEVIAGRSSLNTAQKEVLQSLFKGALWDEALASTVLSTSDASTLANNVLASTNATASTPTPFENMSQLVVAGMSYGGLSGKTSKNERETLTRVLTSGTQARTWNLLVDLVAQVGHYTPNSSSLSQFVVEGERRYWLHVAVDRYTNEILKTQLELVNE